jgi:hypothetical protein
MYRCSGLAARHLIAGSAVSIERYLLLPILSFSILNKVLAAKRDSGASRLFEP